MEFNPDQYLAEKSGASTGFDPDAYLAQKAAAPSVAGAAARGALDAVPMGVKLAGNVENTLNPSKSTDKYVQELDAMLASDKASQPVAHGAGEVLGSVAPFAIPGVGEALAGETMAGRAAIGAGIGGLQGASNNRNPDDLGTDIAKGAAVGAVAQPIAGAAGSLANMVIPEKQTLVNSATARLLGGNARQLTHLTPNPEVTVADMGNFVEDHDLQHMDQSSSQLREAVKNNHDQAGQKIGAMIKGYPGGDVDIKPIVLQLGETSKFATPDAQAHIASIAKELTNAADKNGNINFLTLHNLKAEIGHEAYPKSGLVNKPLADTYHLISDAQDKALQTSGGPFNSPEFQQAKKDYAITSRMMPMLNMGQAKELQKGATMGSALPATAFGAVGHPGIAGAAAMGAVLKPGLENFGRNAFFGAARQLNKLPTIPTTGTAPAVANAASNVVSGPDLSHSALAPFKAHFDAATKGITDPADRQKTITTTDYVLQQNNPAYAKAKQEAADAQNNQ